MRDMNRYYYLFMALACCLSLAGMVYGAQSSNQPANNPDLLYPEGDSPLPDIQTISKGMKGTGPEYQEASAVQKGDQIVPDMPGSVISGNQSPVIQGVDNSGTGSGPKPAGWLTYLEDPRYTIQIPPGWSVYQTSTTPDNGSIIMFQDNQPSPSFVSVMAADSRAARVFTSEEAGELEENHIYPSFKEWGLRLIPEERRYALLGQASISHCVIAGGSENQVVSSFLLSDPSNYYWVSLIGPDADTYQEMVGLFNRILYSFTPSSSSDASRLWHGE